MNGDITILLQQHFASVNVQAVTTTFKLASVLEIQDTTLVFMTLFESFFVSYIRIIVS